MKISIPKYTKTISLLLVAFALLLPSGISQDGQGKKGGGQGRANQNMTADEWRAQQQAAIEKKVIAFDEGMGDALDEDTATELRNIVTQHFVQKLKIRLQTQTAMRKELQDAKAADKQMNRESMQAMRIKHNGKATKNNAALKKQTDAAAKDLLDKKQFKKYQKVLAKVDPAPVRRGPGGGGQRGGGGGGGGQRGGGGGGGGGF